ncbi:unnamed protein product [Prorocentrum cordatum]|uniref:Uncharacterized protein n=1 Tax=Prorocentrum cordatum TaxID=2364126 RepID=A0ABN9V1C8_9DINO|nr:unnamed protein product [Polarella glacialis]
MSHSGGGGERRRRDEEAARQPTPAGPAGAAPPGGESRRKEKMGEDASSGLWLQVEPVPYRRLQTSDAVMFHEAGHWSSQIRSALNEAAQRTGTGVWSRDLASHGPSRTSAEDLPW